MTRKTFQIVVDEIKILRDMVNKVTLSAFPNFSRGSNPQAWGAGENIKISNKCVITL